jgi:hypothetical protein
MVATACSLVRVSAILNYPSILVDFQSDENSNTSKAKQIEDLQDRIEGASSFHQTKYLKNNPQKANSAAKEKGLEPRQKDDSDSKTGVNGLVRSKLPASSMMSWTPDIIICKIFGYYW